MIIVSGVQPSGRLHLGNYFGAIKQHLELQNQGEAYFFIANYHALTTINDGKLLRDYTYQIAAAYLALGLDPLKACIFKQSDVPEVTELAWILSTVTGFGLMSRCHAFKEKVDKGLSASVGLFTYPILMTADILAYDADIVPVGPDQIQHIEVAKDLATAFNAAFGGREILKKPQAKYSAAGKVPGTDGQKMSKSLNNIIPIFANTKEWKKIIASIITDSTDYTQAPLPTENETIFTLYSLMASPTEKAQMYDDYVNNRTFGYGHAKQRLLAKIEETFSNFSQEYQKLLGDTKRLDTILADGAGRARNKAQATLKRVREVCGL